VLFRSQFWLDEAQWRFVGRPVVAAFQALARLERRLLGPFGEESES
jgi:hypothetical protein